MNLKILTFGIARDIVGGSTFSFTVARGTTVAQLKQTLLDRYPTFGNLSSLLIAVNEEYGDDDTIIEENDDIALIPPVSGG
ncbi:MAG: MoaD/ThiS family protein [Saprospiraceae bacterium]|nr:MoaD/ThiS family protein [Saprospiraceae bacterium]